MTEAPVDVAPVGLVVVRAAGDHEVHLAMQAGGECLCGRKGRARPPQQSFRLAGCGTCLDAALRAGHLSAREGDRSWLNLRRLASDVGES
jgi:hypothetical protein